LGWICAAVTVLLAGMTLLEYATGVTLGLDRLVPGRTSPHAATAFLLLGASLLLLDRRTPRGTRPAEILALAAGAIPLTALLGYLLSVPALYSVPRSTCTRAWRSTPWLFS
jgi:hypothetical protein